MKPQQAGTGASKRPDENVCGNSAANCGNTGAVSANSQNIDSKCDAGSMPSSTGPPAEMLVFSLGLF